MDNHFPWFFELFIIIFSDFYFITINSILLIILLLLSALVSGSEVAYFSLTPEEIEKCNLKETPVQKRMFLLLAKPKRLLATILILNNFINIAIVMLYTYFFIEILELDKEKGTLLISLTIPITFLIVFFGEIVPKVYANKNNLQFARFTSGLLKIFYIFFKPFAWVLTSINNIVEKRIEKKGYHISVNEMHQVLELTTKEGTTEEEKDILKGIVNFSTLSVKQVMKSRLDIFGIESGSGFKDVINQVKESRYSRIPIYNETIDNIEGILYIKDLLAHLEEDNDYNWRKLVKKPGFFIPETKKIDTLFKDFQYKRVHIAIVVDEYGGTSGLITMEDVIEEIVGEINDEFDNEIGIPYNKIDNHTYIFESKTSLMDFCKITNMNLNAFDKAKGESKSLGGLILELSSKLPKIGEKIKYKGFVFTIIAADKKKIKRIRVFIN